MSALAALAGVGMAVGAQMGSMRRQHRLYGRLRRTLETLGELPDGERYAMLRATLEDVAAYCAQELALRERQWLERRTTAGRLRAVPPRLIFKIAAAVGIGVVGNVLMSIEDWAVAIDDPLGALGISVFLAGVTFLVLTMWEVERSLDKLEASLEQVNTGLRPDL
jgi:hypothetical protein